MSRLIPPHRTIIRIWHGHPGAQGRAGLGGGGSNAGGKGKSQGGSGGKGVKPPAATGPAIVQSVVNLQASHAGGSCAWGAATVAGNLLLMVSVNAASDTGTLPSGWTRNLNNTDTGTVRLQILSIPNSSSRSGTESIGSLTAAWITALIEVSGLTNGGVLDVSSSHSKNANTCDTSATGVTTTAASEFVIACLAASYDTNDGMSNSFTELFGGLQLPGGAGNLSAVIGYKILSATATSVLTAGTLASVNLNVGSLAAYKGA